MNDRELDRAIAEAQGYWVETVTAEYGVEHDKITNGEDWYCLTCDDRPLPPYATSVDALAPVEQRLKQAGWRADIESDAESTMVRWWEPTAPDEDEWTMRSCEVSPEEPRARAEAARSALQHLNAIQVEGEVAK